MIPYLEFVHPIFLYHPIYPDHLLFTLMSLQLVIVTCVVPAG